MISKLTRTWNLTLIILSPILSLTFHLEQHSIPYNHISFRTISIPINQMELGLERSHFLIKRHSISNDHTSPRTALDLQWSYFASNDTLSCMIIFDHEWHMILNDHFLQRTTLVLIQSSFALNSTRSWTIIFHLEPHSILYGHLMSQLSVDLIRSSYTMNYYPS